MVAQVLQQAATVTASPEGSYEQYDYVISLREGIMDAWSGIIGAMKFSNKSESTSLDSYVIGGSNSLFAAPALQPYFQPIFHLLNLIANDMNRSEPLMRSTMGVIG